VFTYIEIFSQGPVSQGREGMVKTYFKFAAANGFLVLGREGMVPALDHSFKEASKPNII
jgi:hypothetical protein